MPPLVRSYRHRNSSVVLRREDCVAGLREFEQQVDVVVTSPPYNLGVDYSQYDDTISRERYLEWMAEFSHAVKQALADDGSLFLNIAGKPSDPMVPFQVLEVLRRDFQLQNVIHWIKSVAIRKEDVGDYPGITQDVSVGHHKPINSRRYLTDCHEYIFHLTKKGDVVLDRLAIGVPYQDKSNIDRWRRARRDLRCRGNTWFIPYETIRRRATDRPHPASFPVKLPAMCILVHGLPKVKLACDPFLGIGPSAVAAVRLGVDFVGFEIDQDYFNQACAAVETEIGREREE